MDAWCWIKIWWSVKRKFFNLFYSILCFIFHFRLKNGPTNLHELVTDLNTKKRKRRTSFTPQALERLNDAFELNTHPSGVDMSTLAQQLNYDREVIRVW